MKEKQKLYLMKNDFGLYKIGISKEPTRRVAEIRNSSGIGVEILHVWEVKDDAATIERRLHQRYREHRKYGEWFSFVPVRDLETCLAKWRLQTIEKRMIELCKVVEVAVQRSIGNPSNVLSGTKWEVG
jgi:predicted GIY-YIG superfamily endonuclease